MVLPKSQLTVGGHCGHPLLTTATKTGHGRAEGKAGGGGRLTEDDVKAQC